MTFACRGFLFRMLLYFLETLSHAVGNPTHQLKGILGGSVLFPANVSQGITVQKMEWDFRPQRRDLGYWWGKFSHWNQDHPSPTGRFGQRLDMVDKTTLRIKDLELDDGGIYNTRIWFTKTQFQEQRFSLTVYEPVPTPQIRHQVESKTPGGCNVTLRCHTPGREDLSISWQTGDPHKALGKSANQYQVSDNGRELRVFYWNSSLDSKFTCLVSNPVDQKRTSFDLHNICQSDEGGHLRISNWNPWLFPSLIVLLVIMVMVVMLMRRCWKIRLERHGRGVGSLMREKGDSTLELQNSKMIDPKDGDDEVDSDREDFLSSSTAPVRNEPAPSGTLQPAAEQRGLDLTQAEQWPVPTPLDLGMPVAKGMTESGLEHSQSSQEAQIVANRHRDSLVKQEEARADIINPRRRRIASQEEEE